jgi:hypothetical protein
MLMVCEIMNDLRIRLSVWCLIRNCGCMLILEIPYMTYVYIYIYVYFEQIQYSSLFSGNLFPYFISSNALDISSHRDTLLKVYPRICQRILWRKSEKPCMRERMVPLDLGHFGISTPGVSKCESSCTRESRNPDPRNPEMTACG